MAPGSLILEATKKTPRVVLDSGHIIITGRSISENPAEFYRPVHEWISAYASESARMTEIELGFEFINTTSIKWVYAILKELSRMPDLAQHAKISWYYEEGDDDMCDLGFILRSLVSCPFHIIEVDDINSMKFERS
jgi:hypothetical protein